MNLKYDPANIETYYDAYGEQEWSRLIKDPAGLVSFHIHQHYLEKYVKSNNLVLELNAGTGIFSIKNVPSQRIT